ncbi:ABC transporter ATP-binding protein [Nocardia sp. 2]|uniref:ABC transporter ATP-binding protein n=1 Tax=Nocardia acididurans TaxID=2802282 RepID=A0ABS1MA74_9NOCA|nr:ATP-binding cassette domain-containing protein [Nocardia acididurans]MBL1077459.1 ABC transporter ATP-binding protein [Nocardia acididurans]
MSVGRAQSAAIQVEGLTIAAEDGRLLLRDTTFRALEGRVLALTGASGAGKTTLLRAVTGWLPPGTVRTGGRVRVLGEDVFELDERGVRELRRRRIAYVGQDPGAALNPRMRVRSLVRELTNEKTDPAVLLADVRLPSDASLLAARPRGLSGGQQRRVAIARALARRPEVLLLDEPTAGLHPGLRDEIGDLLLELARARGLAVVLACHDLELVERIADDVVHLTPSRVPVGTAGPQERRPRTGEACVAPNGTAGPQEHRSRTGEACVAPIGTARPQERRLRTGEAGVAPIGRLITPAEPSDAPTIEVAPSSEGAQSTPASGGADSGDSTHPTESAGAGFDTRQPVLAVRGLYARFADSGVEVLRDIALAVGTAEAVGIVGPSGSGKTTLARVIVGLQPAERGVVVLDGAELRGESRRRSREERRRVQLVPQNPLGALNPSRTVGATLARPLRLHRRCARGETAARVTELLAAVHLEPGFAQRFPHELSGGQRQRVAIARALAAEPDVLICDEVTSALDGPTADAIMDLLAELRELHRLALVVIAHDLPLIADRTDTVAVLDSGRVVEFGGTAEVFADPAHEVTRALLSRAPVTA